MTHAPVDSSPVVMASVIEEQPSANVGRRRRSGQREVKYQGQWWRLMQSRITPMTGTNWFFIERGSGQSMQAQWVPAGSTR